MFNPNAARRNEIIGIDPGESYDVVRFKSLTHEQGQQLLDENFARPRDCQNGNGPTFAEIVSFLKENPSFRAHGYIVTPRRSDYRVTLEGIMVAEGVDPSLDEVQAFIDLCHGADEFTCNLAAKNFYGAWD